MATNEKLSSPLQAHGERPRDLEVAASDSSISSGPNEKLNEFESAAERSYSLKCALVNKCMQEEVGFGRYQIQLFILSGLGWAADNIWLQGIAVVLPQVQQELAPKRVEYATMALYVGLIVGASFWGVLADIIGRKLSFNITLFIAGVFGIAAGAAPNFIGFASLIACIGFGIGGNLPVDGALYLEHLPQSHQWTLTLLSAWWAIGQLIASLLAWVFIANFSCDPDAAVCLKEDNMGWRYTIYTLGGITFAMFVARFLIFDLKESSKFLIAKGRDADAIEVLQHLAKRNGRPEITLTLAKLQAVDGEGSASGVTVTPPTTMDLLKGSLSGLSLSHVKPLFVGRKLAINTSITIFLWGLIGLAYPLYNSFLPLYLKERVSVDASVGQTYRDYAIISICGIPGSFLACLVIDWSRGEASKFAVGGRKLCMAISTLLTGIFLFLFTTSKTEAAVLGFSCASAVTQNAMYGVLFAYTPEVFPAPHRGTADAICSAFNRMTGILAPAIKIATTSGVAGAASGSANAPIFVSASLFIVAATFMMLLPIETAGVAAL